MRYLFIQVYHKVACTLALIAVGLSVGWFLRHQAVIRSLLREPIRPDFNGTAYEPRVTPLPGASKARWSKPPAQSRGGDWFYEVFTPPAITYNPVAGTFAVAPSQPHPELPLALSRLELLSVGLEPYRLQLVGYFGEPGNYLAAFANPLSGETLVARPGHRFESFALTLKSLEVRKVVVEGGDPGPVYEVAALAVLQEDISGTEVMLDSRTRKFTDKPMAVFKLLGVSGRTGELHEGESFACDGDSYRIGRIQLDPAEVVVAKISPDQSVVETRVLHPVGRDDGKESQHRTLAPMAATDVAAANP